MYKHGQPIYTFNRRQFGLIMAGLVLLLAGLYFIFIATNKKTDLRNNNKPLVSTVTAQSGNTNINEADFRLDLPGQWKLTQKDWDARYHAWQWQLSDPKVAAGRWFRVYEDNIPTDYPYGYLIPVEANGVQLAIGQTSGACADFTTTGTKVTSTANGSQAVLSKWQSVNFYCDYGHQALQTVGTSSKGSINSVTMTGFSGKTHKFFFLYEDNNITPDLSLPATILSSFTAK